MIRNIKEYIRIIVGMREESRVFKKVIIFKKRNRKLENKGLWIGECVKLWKVLSRLVEYGGFFFIVFGYVYFVGI